MFEIEVVERDLKGKPTGKRKYLKTDNPYKIWEFFSKNAAKPRRKKRKQKTKK